MFVSIKQLVKVIPVLIQSASVFIKPTSARIKSTIIACLTILSTSLLTGCATTLYVSKQVENKEYPVNSFYSRINKAAILENIVVLEVERGITPEQYATQYNLRSKLCFEMSDFMGGVGLYIHPKDNNLHTCSDIPDALFNSLPTLEPIPNQKKGFIIPELRTVIYGTGNKSVDTRCACDALKDTHSVPKNIYHFGKYLFYIELENGQWVKLTGGERVLFITPFEAELISEDDFEQEKATSVFNAQETLFETVEAGQQYFFIRMLYSKEYIYSYTVPQSHTASSHSSIFSEPITSLFIQNDKVEEEIIVEEGNPLFYMLYPFSVVFDVITFPVQYGVYVYHLSQANRD